MIDINDFRTFFYYILNKEGKGSEIRTSDFNIIVNRAVAEWTQERYGNEKEYQPGRPIPRIAYDQTRKITDDLGHLKELRRFNVTSGRLSYPDGTNVTDINGAIAPDYLHFSALYLVKYSNNVEILEEMKEARDDEYHNYQPGRLLEATDDYPVFNFQDTFFRFLPKDISQVEFVYLRQPVDAVWAFTVVSGREVYDAGNSTDIDAPQEAFNEIAMMALSYTGIRLREQDVIQYTELQKAQGV